MWYENIKLLLFETHISDWFLSVNTKGQVNKPL